jgi:SAM-dependent methyltransferase
MSNASALPFDVFRPFKNTIEAFTPRDTLPWAELAPRVLRYMTEDGIVGLRPWHAVDATIDWVDEQLGLPGEAAILDIGCGPGLYSNRLAARGYRVTGIDIADPFLEHARAEAQAHGLSCDYRKLSMFEMTFDGEFASALLLQSIAGRLSELELRDLLLAIRRALQPGGSLICEFQVKSARFASAEPTVTESLSLLGQSPWSDEPHAWLLRDLYFPASDDTVSHHLILRADGAPAEYWSCFRLYSVPALTELLEGCGLEVRAAFGPLPGRGLQPDDSSCLIWAQRC